MVHLIITDNDEDDESDDDNDHVNDHRDGDDIGLMIS